MLLVARGRADAQESLAARRPPQASVSVSTEYAVQAFDDGTAPWHLGSVSLWRKGGAGSLIGRINVGRRFGSSGVQGEVDAYLRLGDRLYGYLNVGYAESGIFPRWRSGAELFASLPRAWEASLGYRQLRFGGAPVTLLTGSLGRYTGNYWLSLRPYVRGTGSGTSASAGLTVRRYYEDGDHYVGLRVGAGGAPSEQATAQQLARTGSRTIAVEASAPVRTRLLLTAALGAEQEVLQPGARRSSVTLSTGLKWRL